MPFIELDFPREVLEIGHNGRNGGRYLVRNWDELERYWKGKNGRGNAYFTAYGYRRTNPPKHHRVEYNSAIVRHFVMDFDCKDFKNRGQKVDFGFMQEQVRRLHKHFLDNDFRHFVWFSGGGYHIYVPISETLTPTDGLEVTRIKQGGRNLLRKWDKKLDLSCNDPTVAFDLAGMIRIPNSYNMRRGCWTIPLSSHEILSLSHEELIEIAQEPREGYIEIGRKDIHLVLPEKRESRFKSRRGEMKDLPSISLNNIKVLPCLAQAALGEGNPIHRARFHLASYLADRLRWFFPPESVPTKKKEEHVKQIVDILSEQGWVDWDRDITTTQVSSIVMGSNGHSGYKHANCLTLMQEGLCVGKCEFYDGTAEVIA
tara:strand:+ start:1331 stop:2443 length:1113 start_codon:yes stop_codon:yes gene_type:complete